MDAYLEGKLAIAIEKATRATPYRGVISIATLHGGILEVITEEINPSSKFVFQAAPGFKERKDFDPQKHLEQMAKFAATDVRLLLRETSSYNEYPVGGDQELDDLESTISYLMEPDIAVCVVVDMDDAVHQEQILYKMKK